MFSHRSPPQVFLLHPREVEKILQNKRGRAGRVGQSGAEDGS